MSQFHDSDWWSVELQRMLEEQRPEDSHLDYKAKEGLLPPGRGGVGIDKQKRAEDISKDVSAFLNSDGGVLVYGVPETNDPNVTGGSPIPDSSQVGFQRGEFSKETIENLITSNIQPKPGPDLFQVTEVTYSDDSRVVFVVEVAVGIGDVWQAKDKRYYRRFHYKAEPMEHHEINMVRDRNLGPNLKLVFGLNDRWEANLSNSEYIDRRRENVQIHVGIQNTANTVAESALIELGLYLYPIFDEDSARLIHNGKFPENLFPNQFMPVGIRTVKWDSDNNPNELRVAWGQLFWNSANPGLAGRYAPIFKTEAPLPVAVLKLNIMDANDYAKHYYGAGDVPLASFFWKIQAPDMKVRTGFLKLLVNLHRGNPTPLRIEVDEKDWEIT